MTQIETEKTDMNPLRLEGTKKEDIEGLRKLLHTTVDSMLDAVEFDTHGDAVNQIAVLKTRGFVRYPAMADIYAMLPGERKLELTIGPTYRELKEEIDRLDTADMVKSAQANTFGATVMRAKQPDPPPTAEPEKP